jgi:putative hydrolase of the HAD superfamily
MNKVKTVIFDLGVVVIDINDQYAIDYLISHKIKNADVLFQRSNDYCVQYETGKISSETFIAEINKLVVSENFINLNIIETAWRKIIVDIPDWKIKAIKALGEKYKILALSNTNALHVDEIDQLFKKKGNPNEFFSLFHKSYLSHQVGLIKPHPEIFYHIIKDADIKPSTSLFLDDLASNLISADKLGFQTNKVNNDLTFKEVIEALL